MDEGPSDSPPFVPRSPSRAVVAAVLLCLLTGVLLRGALIDGRTHLTHDEAIAYMAASGHQLTYDEAARETLRGEWVEAAEWQALLEPGPGFAFRGIHEGLARTDVHPPLYFWLLHLWLKAFGAETATGPLMNLLLFALTGLILFMVARRWLRNDWEAVAVTALYAVSTRTCHASMIARPYELYALCVMLVALGLTALVCADPARARRPALLLGVALFCGLMTHYQFVLIAFGGFGAAGAYLFWRRDARILPLACAGVGGAAAWFAMQPHAFNAAARFGEQGAGFDAAEIIPRFERTLALLTGFVADDLLWWREPLVHTAAAWLPKWAALGLAAAIGVAALTAGYRYAKGRRILTRPRRDGFLPAALLLLSTGGAVFGMYWLQTRGIASIDPPRYTLIVGLGMAFVPVLAVRVLKTGAAVGVMALLLAFMAASTLHDMRHTRSEERQPPAVLAEAPRIVVGSVDRGILPPVAQLMPDTTEIFAAPLTVLEESSPAWLPMLEPGDAFIAHISYANTMADYERVLAQLRARFRVDGEWGLSQGYLVHRLAPLPPDGELPPLPWQRFMASP